MIKNIAAGGSNRTLLFLALLMGLLCAALVGVYLNNLEGGSGGGSSSTVPVVVAATDIPALTTITSDMVTLSDVPEDMVLAGAFTDPGAVVGKKTQVAIVPGQQLLTTNAVDAALAQEAYGPDAPLSLIIPAGKRAYAIYVSKVASVGGLARAGDYVDLMLNADSADGTTSSACYVMQDVQVLAVGATVASAAPDASGVASVATNPDATTYSLAVTPEQALTLAATQRSVSDGSVGKQMWVVLRQFGDHGVAGVPACPAQ
jgi:Flp pilus assembly protein CpaB